MNKIKETTKGSKNIQHFSKVQKFIKKIIILSLTLPYQKNTFSFTGLPQFSYSQKN
jgi:hypothetical protein